MTNNSLFLIGGTGGLGIEMAKGLVTAEGFDDKKAIVRDSGTDKAKILADMGWTLVELKDYNNAKALEEALSGAKTVVSTLGGNDLVPLEISIIRAAKTAGASLFVPSLFGVDVRRWGTSFPFFAGKSTVLEAAQKEGLPVLTVNVGDFSDMIFGFFCDIDNAKVTWVGDGTDKVTWTRRSDIGYVLAKALADPKLANGGDLSMQGDYMSFNDATALLGKSLGKTFEISYMDPQEALKEEQELLKKGVEGDVGAFFRSFKLHLMGEPARGNDGCDLSKDCNNYGHKMETLEDVFRSGVYAS